MNREEALEIWAPRNSRWGAWTKPLLFSFMSDPLAAQVDQIDSGWRAKVSSDAAILVELAGAEAVIAGMQLSRFGYRPIPLFNACPFGLDDSGANFAPALVDVISTMRALERNTTALYSMNLPESAPPAFLLDANRSRGPLFPSAGVFDNRSIVRESDLPSGEILKQVGIRRVILITAADKLSRDLRTILLSWQHDGLQIQIQRYGEEWNPTNHSIKPRNSLSVLIDRLVMWFVFRTNSQGSFGRIVHSAGG